MTSVIAPDSASPALPERLWLRGRWFSQAELCRIRQIVTDHYDAGRTKASEAICEELDWRQPNGWLKDRACREVLLQMEKLQLLQLPPRRADAKGNATRVLTRKSFADSFERPGCVERLNPKAIKVVQVKGSSDEPLWNWLVATHHYLGFTVGVGRCLKYLVYQDAVPVAALAFATAAWAVGARDRALTSVGYSLSEIRDLLIGNVRFVIFPWASVPNLASCVLSASVRAVADDWKAFYSITPHAVETFVDTTRFAGTSYKAANWLAVGYTRGYMKSGGSHRNGQTRKAVLIYPLSTILRHTLSDYILGPT